VQDLTLGATPGRAKSGAGWPEAAHGGFERHHHRLLENADFAEKRSVMVTEPARLRRLRNPRIPG